MKLKKKSEIFFFDERKKLYVYDRPTFSPHSLAIIDNHGNKNYNH